MKNELIKLHTFGATNITIKTVHKLNLIVLLGIYNIYFKNS